MLSVGGRFHGGAPPWQRPRPTSCLTSPPASSSGGGAPADDSEKLRPLLVERYRDGVAKRYMLDGDSKLQVRLEKHEHLLNNAEDGKPDSSIPRAITDFVLPAGFPGSVSDDYLQYMLWQFPTNVTGWICHTLVTSSLLKIGTGCRCWVLYRNFSSCFCCCYQMGIKRWHRSFWASSHWWTFWNAF